jgi:hypothetical protein
MRQTIHEVADALRTLGKPDPWSAEVKATDDFLDPLFRKYFARLNLPLTFRKADYHALARFLPTANIDAEVVAKLDAIVGVAGKATPRSA